MARPIIPLKHFNSHEEMFVLRVHGVACGIDMSSGDTMSCTGSMYVCHVA